MDAASPMPETCEESAAWKPIDGSWTQVFGSFPRQGLSVEWHDFSSDTDLDWSRSFHSRSLEVCLNFTGGATLGKGKAARALGAREVAVYTAGRSRPAAVRTKEGRHRFITIEVSPEYLGAQLAPVMDAVRDEARRFIEGGEAAEGDAVLETRPMPAPFLGLRDQFIEPPIVAGARAVWYPSKVAEVMSQLLFKPEDAPEMFCERRKRLMRERIERVCFLLRRDLENPPSLEMLAQEVGCSTFYLSRSFSQVTGVTLPQYLRQARIEKAAELLRGGGKNVTEVAFEVGYTSLSAFNSAFVEIVGCCPGLYPVMKGKGGTGAGLNPAFRPRPA